jgi:hypothetical protein
MWNRTFKKETLFVIFGEPWKEPITVKDNRSIKKLIYTKGVRHQEYIVREIDENGTILNEWRYKYLDNGIIFTKRIYSKLKEDQERARAIQNNLFT